MSIFHYLRLIDIGTSKESLNQSGRAVRLLAPFDDLSFKFQRIITGARMASGRRGGGILFEFSIDCAATKRASHY